MPQAEGLYYEVHGPDAAPPLILSSGLGGSAGYWAPNLAALARTHRVVAYDHRGTGRSDAALPDPTPAGMAGDVVMLMDALGIERAALIGHALGAAAGLEAAARAPERIARLVLVNGWADPDPHFVRCFAARLALLRHSGTAAYLRAQPIFLYPANWISAHDAAIEAELPHQLAGFPGVETMERRIAALGHWRLADPERVTCPTLVVVSADDMLVPADAGRRLAALLPDATLAALAWGGHACTVTDPARFAAVIADFLES